MRTLRAHRRDLGLLILLLSLGILGTGYILSNQSAFRLGGWFPGVDYPVTIQAEFADADGVVPGYGQPVTVAGVQVGQVGDVRLDGDVALVDLELEPGAVEVHSDATVLLRPRTQLKDMFVALDPGTKDGAVLADGDRLPASQTEPSVAFSDLIDNLDGDTRDYLRALLAAGAQGFGGDGYQPDGGRPDPQAVEHLRAAFKHFRPFARDTRRLTAALAARRENLRNFVSDISRVSTAMASVDREIASGISGSQRVFSAAASRDADIATMLQRLPGALATTRSTLGKTVAMSHELKRTTTALEPMARALDPALASLPSFFRSTELALAKQLRPFARDAQPILTELSPALRDLDAAAGPLDSGLGVFERFFNALANDPAGSAQSYAFWGSWLAHNAASITSLQDAHGVALRSLPLATCAQLDALHQIELGNPSLNPILKLINIADREKVCPDTELPF